MFQDSYCVSTNKITAISKYLIIDGIKFNEISKKREN